MASQEKSMPFIKNLASSDRKTRTAALTSLETFLTSRQHATSLALVEILKLWKGLYYALWMCDRPLPQQALCTELADLVFTLPPEAVLPWLEGFWATMSREWTGIDVLRMEKFLLLVRRVLGASFRWMKGTQQAGHKLDRRRAESILELLQAWPFRTDEDGSEKVQAREQDPLMPKVVPAGLKIHVLDIWVDEAEKTGLLESGEQAEKSTANDDSTVPGSDVLERINALAEALQNGTTSTAVRIRAKDSLADDRLPWNIKGDEKAHGGEGDSWDGFDD